jgi:hypothetical protein
MHKFTDSSQSSSAVLATLPRLQVEVAVPLVGAKTGIAVASRIDIFLRLLMPATPFKVLVGADRGRMGYVVWPAAHLDLLALSLHSNPLFANSKLFDISAYAGASSAITLYYIFSVPAFSSWLVLFLGAASRVRGTRSGVVSIETLFKSAA